MWNICGAFLDFWRQDIQIWRDNSMLIQQAQFRRYSVDNVKIFSYNIWTRHHYFGSQASLDFRQISTIGDSWNNNIQKVTNKTKF